MTTSILLITWWQKIHTWSLSSFTIWKVATRIYYVVHHPRVHAQIDRCHSNASDKFLSFQIGNLRFVDSLQFLIPSLDTLVQSLAVDGKDKFSHIARHYPDSDLVLQRDITLMNTWTEETNFYYLSCLPSTLSTVHIPKKLSLRKSTTGRRKSDENSASKTCINTANST